MVSMLVSLPIYGPRSDCILHGPRKLTAVFGLYSDIEKNFILSNNLQFSE